MTLWGRLGATPFLLPSFLLNLPTLLLDSRVLRDQYLDERRK
jgi:hypothetical protein